MLVKKYFWQKKCFGQKNLWGKIFGPKTGYSRKGWIQKIFMIKKMFGPMKIGSKKIRSKTILGLINLDLN